MNITTLTTQEVHEQLSKISMKQEGNELTVKALINIREMCNLYKTLTDEDPRTNTQQFCLLFEELSHEEVRKAYFMLRQLKQGDDLMPAILMYFEACYLLMLDYLSILCDLFDADNYVDSIIEYAGKYIERDLMEKRHLQCHELVMHLTLGKAEKVFSQHIGHN